MSLMPTLDFLFLVPALLLRLVVLLALLAFFVFVLTLVSLVFFLPVSPPLPPLLVLFDLRLQPELVRNEISLCVLFRHALPLVLSQHLLEELS